MGPRWRLLAGLIILSFLSACGGSTPTPAGPSGGASTVSTARAYLDTILDLMQANSVNRRIIDWPSFRASVYESAGAAQTVQELVASNAIRTALGLLNDHHSLYMKADGTYIYNPVPLAACSDANVGAVSLPATVGYVKVGGTSAQGDAAVQFALAIQNEIAAADDDRLTGWIVDTRNNSGGNMYPMIAGIGPVLGEGVAGVFIDADGSTTRWGYAAGSAWLGGEGSAVVTVPAPYRLRRANAKVAVLTNCGAASSGEAVVVSFRARPNTRSFGTPTRGLSTANKGFPLADGATLFLTAAVMADRTAAPYGAAIAPDEVISEPSATVARAVEWLRGQ